MTHQAVFPFNDDPAVSGRDPRQEGMTALERIISHVGYPFRPGKRATALEWQTLESTLGIAFPTEYMQVNDLFGDVEWVEYLTFLTPFTYLPSVLQSCEGLRMEYTEWYPSVHSWYPKPGGLLPFGFTSTRIHLCMPVSVDRPYTADVFIAGDGMEIEHFPGGVLSFLYEAFRGRLKSKALNRDYLAGKSVRGFNTETGSKYDVCGI